MFPYLSVLKCHSIANLVIESFVDNILDSTHQPKPCEQPRTTTNYHEPPNYYEPLRNPIPIPTSRTHSSAHTGCPLAARFSVNSLHLCDLGTDRGWCSTPEEFPLGWGTLWVGALCARSSCGRTQVGNLCHSIALAGTATERFGINEDLAHAEC